MSVRFDKTFDFSAVDTTFRDFMEFAPVGVLIFQKDFIIKYVNKNFFSFHGVVVGNPSTFLGKSLYQYRIFDDIDLRKDLTALEKGAAFEKELVASRTLGGGKISVIIKCTPIMIDGSYSGGIIVIEDVKVGSEKTDVSLLHSSNFRNFLLLISDIYFIVDRDGNVKLSSAKSSEEFDFLIEPEPLKNVKRSQRLSGILFRKLIESVVNTNKAVQTEIPFVKHSIQQKVVITIIPFMEEASNVDTILVLVKKVEEEASSKMLQDEEISELKKYQQIVTETLDGVIGVDGNGKVNFWNESAANLFGLTRSEVFGKYIGKIFPQIDEKYFSGLKEGLSSSKIWDDQLMIGDEDGVAEYYSIKAGRIGDESEQNIIMLCSNITHRVKIERELRKSEERFRNIVTNSQEYICTLDLSGKITYANPHFLDVFMYSENEIRQLHFIDLIDPNFLMNSGFNIKEIQNDEMQSVEIPMLTKLGQRVYVLTGFTVVYDLNEIAQYYNVILTDITLKKESEKDLLLIRSIFEASLDGIALLSKNRFVLVNDSFVKMFGYKSASEILGEDPSDFVGDADVERISGYIKDFNEGKSSPESYEFTGKRLDNSTLELENSVSFYEADDEKFLVWVLRDITEKKKFEKALKVSEERYRSISENINQSFWTAENIGGEIKTVFYSPAIQKITGYSEQEFINENDLWQKIIHPDDAASYENKIRNLYIDPQRDNESIEFRIIDNLGNVIWLENKITVNRNTKGDIEKVFGIISDVTIAKKAEEELKKSANDLKELNEAKDRFISIISHDLRTPFTSILGYTDFLLTDNDLEEEKRTEYVEFIRESAKSMLGMVNSLLDWTRLQTGRMKFEPDKINARTVINKSIQVLSGAALQKNINLISNLDKDFFIYADQGLLLQVFNNLVSNAIKFTKKKGTIFISAKADIENRQSQFSVKDDGVGIRKEDVDKLFKVDSKFTTPGTAGERGSGLGLSLVYDIVRKHGGDIRVESEYGKGTEFIFTIPVASNYILLVEDVNMDRVLYTKLLQSILNGYTIIEAENGKAALDKIKQFSPALVITDHFMPIMSGYDLVKQIAVAELKYKPPIIVLSSDINTSIKNEYNGLGIEYVFQKPVNLVTFKEAIEKSLKKAVYF